MAYVGPAGLIGSPDEADRENFIPFVVEGEDDITCWIHKEVLEHLKEVSPTREGDYLFVSDGAGRLRFKFCDRS
ncbi:MAG: trimethylamine--corrinoid methyltransferase [Acetomicrobium sp.]|uniref:trimethylamine--corrinoid methyltransferase n=1 Tax=Acetomicrobium sp. TaxID=1872099 RepID=UPI0019B512C9|nr:trimethylamine--corrinoid methyltransferase [Acetomicrobium sp.]MBC7321736.1 trimethylamine--corrinoid methyltransferase [Acetomicrobium sp.]